MGYGVYGDLVIIYSKPYSIYLRVTMAQSQFVFEDVCCLLGRTTFERGLFGLPGQLRVIWGKMEKNMETTKGLEFGV